MTDEPLKVTPSGDKKCFCVANHTPEPRELHRHHVWPLGEGGPDTKINLRWLCPTSHSNVHQLWRIYDACNGRVGGAVLRRYNPYVRQLVADGWAQAHPEPVLLRGTGHISDPVDRRSTP